MSIHPRFRLIFLFACTLTCAFRLHAAEEKKPVRVALVIGNSRYEAAVGLLRNTVNDAKAMSKALGALGFDVTLKTNVSRDEMMAAVMQFRAKLKGAQVGLFYFSGHGISVEGSNYLLPIKSGYTAETATPSSLRLLAETRLFNAEQIVAEMSAAGALCNLIILDACRSTPVARDPSKRDGATAGGLVEMNPPAGSLIAFATDAGRSASDGEGKNGLYTGELIKHLLTPGLSIEQVFKRTRAAVLEISGGKQVPAEYSRLVGDDILLAGPKKVEAPAEQVIPMGRPVPLPTFVEINKLAAGGDLARCIEAINRSARSRGAESEHAAPLGTLLDRVKEDLRGAKPGAPVAKQSLESCEKILAAITSCVPQNDAQIVSLNARAYNRRGDSLLLLGRADEALSAFNAAATLTPDDAYVLYNRGRAHLALEKKDEARADFTAALARPRQPGAHKLAKDALAGMK